MSRIRCLVGVLGVLTLGTICLNRFADQRNAALAAHDPLDLLKRIEVLEARVASLEMRPLPRTYAEPSSTPVVPKHWSEREFNGSPVYIIPLGANDKHD
ncbi:MAG: hypothetical protein H6822_04180 [Planctomycetaceae bacterium]|nr:hypothetical protein [Planctomycetales bacterium]MCB9921356.1 hypothetical protein [Planctomycetaceae bacterium]